MGLRLAVVQLSERSERSRRWSALKASPAVLVNEDKLSSNASVFLFLFTLGEKDGRTRCSLTNNVLNQKWNIFSLMSMTLGLFFRVMRMSPCRINGGFNVIRSTPFSFVTSIVGVTWLLAANTVSTGTKSHKKYLPVHKYITNQIQFWQFPTKDIKSQNWCCDRRLLQSKF